jgi:hypothetical protein
MAAHDSPQHRHADAGRHPRQASKSVMIKLFWMPTTNVIPAPARAGVNYGVHPRQVSKSVVL